MSHVLLTHAPDADARAALVAEKLGKLGFEVRQDTGVDRPLSPFERKKLKAEIDAAACVLVLWSRDAAEAPALRAMAERAQASGKLTVARLDSAALPVGLGALKAANLAGGLGRGQTRAWAQLVNAVGAKTKGGVKRAASPRPAAAASHAAPAAKPEKKKGGAGGAILFLLLLAAIGAGGYYAWSTGLLAQWGIAL